jgi:adenylate cyclase
LSSAAAPLLEAGILSAIPYRMGLEIERKFLVVGNVWRTTGRPTRIVQGYLTRDPERVVRIRTAGAHAFITVKGITSGMSRSEFEYPIPLSDARQMLDELCLRPLIAKTRYEVDVGELVWEVDVFESPHSGLIVAEVELPSADHEFERPDWIGAEVTGDARYYNQSLALSDTAVIP